MGVVSNAPPGSDHRSFDGDDGQQQLDAVLAAVDQLPARHAVALRVVQLADDDSITAETLAEVVAAEPALHARLLRLANSSYYGLSNRVSNPAFAVTIVGFAAVRSLALTTAVGVGNARGAPPGFLSRTATVASAAAEVAPRFNQKADEAFSLGLLSTIGQGLLWQEDHAAYRRILRANVGPAALAEAERSRYGMTHLDVSARALRAWALPTAMPVALEELDAEHPPRSLASTIAAALELAERRRLGKPSVDLATLSSGIFADDDAPHLLATIERRSEELLWTLAG